MLFFALSIRAFSKIRVYSTAIFRKVRRCCLTLSDSFSVMGIPFLGEAHECLSNTGFPHLLVDVISTNNAQSCDKESCQRRPFSRPRQNCCKFANFRF